VNNGPEFFVLGPAQPSHRKLGEFDITYCADDAGRVKQLGLEPLHASALNYLSQVVPLPQPAGPADRSLLVVWLGVSETRGGAGGAAGSRSFIANYDLGSSGNEGRNTALTMMIVAHEQFHQLVDIALSDLPPQPSAVWFNESLANYFGLKALVAADKSKSAKDVWAKFIDTERKVDHGLLELNRRYESGDQAVYNLFYSQGATFWHEIDGAIASATGGQRSLDNFLGNLIRTPMTKNGALPISVVEQLRSVVGTSVDQLLLRYVGE
jgi:predicted metalloprotease with PDZ domain